MAIYLLIFSLLYVSSSLCFEIYILKQTKKFNISTLIAFLFIFTYGILPFVIISKYVINGFSISTPYYKYDYSDGGLFYTFFWQFFGSIAYLIIRLGMYRKRNDKKNRNNKFVKKSIKNDMINQKSLQITIFICFIIGLISLYLWSNVYGGIFELIEVGNAVRGGWSKIINPLAFFKHPSRLLLITSFSSLVMIKQSKNRVINMGTFVISFIYSVLFLLANDGRLTFALYFIVLVLIWFDLFGEKKFTLKKLTILIMCAIVGIFIIINLDTITRFIRTGIIKNNENTLWISIIKEFSFVMISGQKAMQHALSGPKLIIHDLLNGIMAWLPSSLKPFQVINIWDYNTKIATSGFSGQFPCDFISTSLYDLSFLGPIVFAVFWGKVVREIEKIKEKNTIFYKICYYSLFMTCFRLVDYCMLYDFVLSVFAIAIFVSVYWGMRKFILMFTKMK